MIDEKLICPNIRDEMQDYVPLQPDIDENKIRSASLIAQNIDIKRLIGVDNVNRCILPKDDSDETLRELIIPPLCYYTYSRLLKMFQGAYTESGFTVEELAATESESKKIANETQSVAEAFMQDVIDFLENEEGGKEDEDIKVENLTPSIRIFGGIEQRASN